MNPFVLSVIIYFQVLTLCILLGGINTKVVYVGFFLAILFGGFIGYLQFKYNEDIRKGR